MNVAGIGAIGQFWNIPAADSPRLIDINVEGVLYPRTRFAVEYRLT
jgi:hypothetical protein